MLKKKSAEPEKKSKKVHVSIRVKLLRNILPIVILSLATFTLISYFSFRNTVEKEINDKMISKLSASSSQLNSILETHEEVSLGVAKALKQNGGNMT